MFVYRRLFSTTGLLSLDFNLFRLDGSLELRLPCLLGCCFFFGDGLPDDDLDDRELPDDDDLDELDRDDRDEPVLDEPLESLDELELRERDLLDLSAPRRAVSPGRDDLVLASRSPFLDGGGGVRRLW